MLKITNEMFQNIKGLASATATNEVAQKQVQDATAVKNILEEHFAAVLQIEQETITKLKAARVGDMMVESTIRPAVE